MTLDEMRASDKRNLAPSDVAEVLGVKPYTVNLTFKKYGPSAFPFEVFPSGNRVCIPRKGFIEWCERAKL